MTILFFVILAFMITALVKTLYRLYFYEVKEVYDDGWGNIIMERKPVLLGEIMECMGDFYTNDQTVWNLKD